MFSEEAADKQEKIDAMIAGPFVAFLKSFSDCCLYDTKFICGETVTIYDMACAGFFINLILNPHCKLGDGMAKKYEECASDKLKKYITDFREEMKDYLSSDMYVTEPGYFV